MTLFYFLKIFRNFFLYTIKSNHACIFVREYLKGHPDFTPKIREIVVVVVDVVIVLFYTLAQKLTAKKVEVLPGPVDLKNNITQRCYLNMTLTMNVSIFKNS